MRRSTLLLPVIVAMAALTVHAAAHDHHAAEGDAISSHSCCCWTKYLWYTLAGLSALSFGTWLLTVVYASLCASRPQNLRVKYDAPWALVTGGSSGIGKALATQLVKDGQNVVIVAVPDQLLADTVKELREAYPQREIRSVGANLAAEQAASYMDVVKAATDDILIQTIFCNAGFMTTGFFTKTSFGRQIANFHCNATSQVHLSHHFLSKLEASGKRGCLAFTSSPACLLPTPMSALYGSTKSFLTEFGASLAPELRNKGIDVLVFHPSPVATRFYDKAHKMGALEMFRSTATGPEVIARCMRASVGKIVVRDQGYYPLMMRFLLKIMDWVFLTEIIARTAHTSGDFKDMQSGKLQASG